MSIQPATSGSASHSQEKQIDLSESVASPQYITEVPEPINDGTFSQALAMPGGSSSFVAPMQQGILEMASQAAGSGAKVLIIAPQIHLNNQRVSNQYDLTGSTGIQIAENIANTNVTESGNKTTDNFEGDVKVSPSALQALKGEVKEIAESLQTERSSIDEASSSPSKRCSSQNDNDLPQKDPKVTESGNRTNVTFQSDVKASPSSMQAHKREVEEIAEPSQTERIDSQTETKPERNEPKPSSAFTRVRYFFRYGSCSSKIFKMRTMLNKRAKAESGRMTHPVKANLSISRVPLQLSTKIERSLEGMDNQGHYNKRCDFEIVMKKTKCDVSLGDVFTNACERAEKKSEQETTEASRRDFVERHGNIVGMIGQAGIGKTTLSRMMLQSIIKGEMLIESQFVFYIPFREVDFVSETTLLKFALTGCGGWKHDAESNRKILKFLESNEKVVFIFDGLDEANTERLSKPTPHCDPYSEQTPDLFVAKILTGDLFPKAKKLITSRPRQFFELHPDYRPHFVVDILGLNEEAQEELCRQICGKSFDVVMKYLQSNPDIFSCCYVPVNCIITMSIIYQTLKEHGKVNLISLTDIFVRALEVYVESDHVKQYQNQVWKLSKLAWDGFLNKKIVFGEADFINAQIDEAVFQAFLCTYVAGEMRGKILEGKKKSSFSHLTWQEMFVAIYLAMFLPFNNFLDLLKDNTLSNPLWEVVSKFLFGLCNSKVMGRLEVIFYPQKVNDWDRKKYYLFSFINSSLHVETLTDQKQFRLFSWIREADNTELNTLVASHVPNQFILSSSLLLTDAVSTVYVMKCAAKPLDIRIEGNVASTNFDYLCDQFASFQVKIKSLDFSHSTIGDDGARKVISNCWTNTLELDLSWCNITSVGAHEIASKLKNHRIKRLDISGNRIGEDGAIAIAANLSNLEELNLDFCGLDRYGIIKIRQELDLLPNPKPYVTGLFSY